MFLEKIEFSAQLILIIYNYKMSNTDIEYLKKQLEAARLRTELIKAQIAEVEAEKALKEARSAPVSAPVTGPAKVQCERCEVMFSGTGDLCKNCSPHDEESVYSEDKSEFSYEDEEPSCLRCGKLSKEFSGKYNAFCPPCHKKGSTIPKIRCTECRCEYTKFNPYTGFMNERCSSCFEKSKTTFPSCAKEGCSNKVFVDPQGFSNKFCTGCFNKAKVPCGTKGCERTAYINPLTCEHEKLCSTCFKDSSSDSVLPPQ